MLTDKQSEFVRQLISGKTQRQAYYIAYPNSKKWKPENVDSKASALLKNDKVLARYKELAEEKNQQAILRAADAKAAVINAALDIIKSDLTDLYDLVPLGDEAGDYYDKRLRIKPEGQLEALKGKSIKKLTYGKHGQPIIEMYDKQKSIDQLVNLLHLDEDTRDNSMTVRMEGVDQYAD